MPRKRAASLPARPTPDEIARAKGKRVPDLLAPRLSFVFCGINPGLYSGAVGHHFARPGNRFWPTLEAAGLTPRRLSPFEDRELLGLGFGITNLVDRATATADELSAEELIAGAKRLAKKIQRLRPRAIAFLGMGAYKTAFGKKKVRVGKQEETIAGAAVWVLPNPSGLNANYQLKDLAREFRKLRTEPPRPRTASGAPCPPGE